jgi:hypothetical protein
LRLRIAGAAKNETEIFTRGALEAIWDYSKGIPRMINIVAQNSMFLRRSMGKKKVTETMVEECRRQLDFHERNSQEHGNQSVYRHAETTQSEKIAGRLRSGWSRWAAPALLLLIAALWGGNFEQWQLPWQASKQSPPFEQNPAGGRRQAKPLIRMKITWPRTAPSKKEPRKTKSDLLQEKKARQARHPQQQKQAAAGNAKPKPKRRSEAEVLNPLSVAGADNLLKLATETYGAVNKPIIQLIREYNSGFTDPAGLTKAGRIVLPALPAELEQPVFTVHVASYKHFKYAQELFERWWKKSRDIHIVLQRNTPEGLVYRVAIGRFGDPAEAKEYAAKLLEEGVFSYAQPIRLNPEKKPAGPGSTTRNRGVPRTPRPPARPPTGSYSSGLASSISMMGISFLIS